MNKSNYLFTLLIVILFSACVDRDFDAPPFPEEVVVEIDDSKVISIADMLSLRTGSAITAVGMDSYLKATIVADDQSGNIYKTLVLQDATGGVSILLDDVELWNKYFEGKEVYVDLNNMWIGDYNDLPQIGFAPVGDNMSRVPAELISTVLIESSIVGLPDPVVKRISQLNISDVNTLIKLEEVQFVNGSQALPFSDTENTQSVNHFVEDCDGNEIILRTSGFASFGSELTPEGKGSLTAVLGIFRGDYQLTLRGTDDASMEGSRCDGSSGSGGTNTNTDEAVFEIDFQGIEDGSSTSIGGWTNIAVLGERVWQNKVFDGNGYTQMTAYNDDNPDAEGWFISPEINTSERTTLSFSSAQAFYEHDGLKVFYSTKPFDGSVIYSDWTEITDVTLASNSSGNHAWVSSGDIDLTQYGSNIHIGFQYVGTSASNTTSYRLDDISIK